jgi:hypothetical protein
MSHMSCSLLLVTRFHRCLSHKVIKANPLTALKDNIFASRKISYLAKLRETLKVANVG